MNLKALQETKYQGAVKWCFVNEDDEVKRRSTREERDWFSENEPPLKCVLISAYTVVSNLTNEIWEGEEYSTNQNSDNSDSRRASWELSGATF